MAITTKLKFLNFKNNNRESKLNDTLERAKTYLSIVESIERTRQITLEQENWLFQNCRVLDEEMTELKFPQLEPAMADAYRTYFQMSHPIATFPTYLKGRFPMDERYIYSALKNNLNGFIQKVEDLIKNPKKFKELSKENRNKVFKILKFDKIKLIELIFAGLFITSVMLLINTNTFIFGFILNIISVLAILILSFINWEEI